LFTWLVREVAGLDDFVGVVGVELDVKDVDVGKAFEEHALPFHNGLAGERADIAKSEDGGSIANHSNEIALGDAGRVGKAQIALRAGRVCWKQPQPYPAVFPDGGRALPAWR
jgi:hypothetical protein